MEFPVKELTPSHFPPLLSEISDPPKKLYLRGTLPEAGALWLCVVGSRKFSSYGRDACMHLIEGLRGYPVVIVSGLALGMDGIAHEAALSAKLKTIAVPGSGLDERVLYPKSHVPLARRILASGGALLSEFEPLAKPRLESFPQRNRIMAGLCHATLIIEGREKAGTAITARLATEYNRDVLTLPHSIFSDTGTLPHFLLSVGATPIRTSHDILDALHIDHEEKKARSMALNEEETRVVSLLREPLQRDALIRALGIPTREANSLLSRMEIEGILTEQEGMIGLA